MGGFRKLAKRSVKRKYILFLRTLPQPAFTVSYGDLWDVGPTEDLLLHPLLTAFVGDLARSRKFAMPIYLFSAGYARFQGGSGSGAGASQRRASVNKDDATGTSSERPVTERS